MKIVLASNNRGKLAELQAASDKRGGTLEWSFLLDSFQAERDHLLPVLVDGRPNPEADRFDEIHCPLMVLTADGEVMTNYQTYLLGFCAAMTGQKLNSEENLSEAELCAFALGLRDG